MNVSYKINEVVYLSITQDKYFKKAILQVKHVYTHTPPVRPEHERLENLSSYMWHREKVNTSRLAN